MLSRRCGGWRSMPGVRQPVLRHAGRCWSSRFGSGTALNLRPALRSWRQRQRTNLMGFKSRIGRVERNARCRVCGAVLLPGNDSEPPATGPDLTQLSVDELRQLRALVRSIRDRMASEEAEQQGNPPAG